MTVLEIHDNECFNFAKGVLKTNIDTPILAKTNSYNGVNYIIFIDGEKLAENLKLKVKSSLKKRKEIHHGFYNKVVSYLGKTY